MVVLICFYSLYYALNRGQNERKLYYSTRLFRKCFVNSVTMRNFSLVARYSLKFTRCSLLIVKSLVTRCKISRHSLRKLLIARNHSLLVAKFACYSLQKLLVAKNHSRPKKKSNKDTTEISVIFILQMYPLVLTLSTLPLPVQKPSR